MPSLLVQQEELVFATAVMLTPSALVSSLFCQVPSERYPNVIVKSE